MLNLILYIQSFSLIAAVSHINFGGASTNFRLLSLSSYFLLFYLYFLPVPHSASFILPFPSGNKKGHHKGTLSLLLTVLGKQTARYSHYRLDNCIQREGTRFLHLRLFYNLIFLRTMRVCFPFRHPASNSGSDGIYYAYLMKDAPVF